MSTRIRFSLLTHEYEHILKRLEIFKFIFILSKIFNKTLNQFVLRKFKESKNQSKPYFIKKFYSRYIRQLTITANSIILVARIAFAAYTYAIQAKPILNDGYI